jgi:hypothetical protein
VFGREQRDQRFEPDQPAFETLRQLSAEIVDAAEP